MNLSIIKTTNFGMILKKKEKKSYPTHRITIIIIKIIIIIIIVIIIIIIIISPRPGNTGFIPVGDSLISWGEGSFLVLVGNPSREGVSIKILVWTHLKPNPQLLGVNYV